MENASKALIIAGAVLLAIVLVSLGVLVINNARKDINDKNLDAASVEQFNSKIQIYCGNNKSGGVLNDLVDKIAASNAAQKNKGDKHYICIELGGSKYGYWYEGTTLKSDLNYPTFDNSVKKNATPKLDKDGYIWKVDLT